MQQEAPPQGSKGLHCTADFVPGMPTGTAQFKADTTSTPAIASSPSATASAISCREIPERKRHWPGIFKQKNASAYSYSTNASSRQGGLALGTGTTVQQRDGKSCTRKRAALGHCTLLSHPPHDLQPCGFSSGLTPVEMQLLVLVLPFYKSFFSNRSETCSQE